jgi:HEAT repeat protein
MMMTNQRAMFIICIALAANVALMGTGQETRPAPAAKRSSPKKELTAEEIRTTSVEEWFRRLGNDEQLGYAPFSVLNALIAKAKEGRESKDEVIRRASETIDNVQQSIPKRWQCCYVLSGIRDKRGIPAIIRALADRSGTVQGVAACALGAFDDAEATSALEAAAKVEKNPDVLESIQKALKGEYRKQVDGTRRAPAAKRSSPKKELTAEEIRTTSVEEWFRRLGNDEQLGYARFSVLNALIAKTKEGPESKDEVIRRATETIDDQQQNMFKRWQCCYVLSGIRDKRGIPAITRALTDQNNTVRGVAACALGAFDAAEATSALEAAAKVEKNPDVLESIQKALKGEYRK